ncbi:MAG: hypothetical protein WAQ25_00160 [Candidatus Saccharimonas sp.]
MTEFDFEELDKAVNNLMSNVDASERNTALDDPEDKVLSLNTTSTVPTSPSASTATPVANSATTAPVAAASAAAPLAVKRRGQFMDMVRPGSTGKQPVSAPVNRQAATVEPLDTTLQPAAPTQEPEPELPMADFSNLAFETEATGSSLPSQSSESSPQLSSEPAVSTEDSSAPVENETVEPTAPEWPDPIDLAMNAPEATTESQTESTEVSPEDELAAGLESVAAEEPTEPLSSPFLPDTKVEKRPLGALSDTLSPAPESEATNTTEASTSVLDGESDSAASEAPESKSEHTLPAELDSEIMSLESSNTGEAVETTDEDTPKTPGITEAENTEVDPVSPIEPGQIVQQYAETPSTGDQSTTAIYDTSTHAQPLAANAPKKSIVKWVIWLLVLAILSVLGGAAYFYFTT